MIQEPLSDTSATANVAMTLDQIQSLLSYYSAPDLSVAEFNALKIRLQAARDELLFPKLSASVAAEMATQRGLTVTPELIRLIQDVSVLPRGKT